MILQDLGIPYEILESSDRWGGRLFTHHFSDEEHDYFDVGAMRFPDTPLMKRTFDLFDRLDIKRGGKLIKYIYQNPENVLFYNSIRRKRSDPGVSTSDEFQITDVPEKYGQTGWDNLVDNVVGPFANALADDVTNGGDEGWKLMMQYDVYSTRAYMAGNRSDTKPELDKLQMMPYPLGVVNWLETFDTSSGSYDVALSEEVLDSLAFAFPEEDANATIDWYCVDGGSSVIADTMVAKLNLTPGDRLYLDTPVSGIALLKEPTPTVSVSLDDGSQRSYSHVITTTTLPCLRTMDLTGAELDYMQKSSLRELAYGAATKIGIKFKTNWWENDFVMKQLGAFGAIVGGQSQTDNMARTIVYPSYGASSGRKSTVLLASYAWTADALALSALMGDDEKSKALLKRRILQDLVAVHGFKPEEGYAFLELEYVEAFTWSWGRNLYTMGTNFLMIFDKICAGAYAQFGPGQFADLYQHLTRPAAEGRLHFAGEVISDRHAWVVGALEASYRAVKEIIMLSYPEKLDEFEQRWTLHDKEWADGSLERQILVSIHRVFKDN
ncbi:FAD/NAD-binding domain-containing protein [Fomitiporia mediterranea MF3/22]|uniref:FAD/NAD-binding domain-containing protein n=1 Tax=Fomitiporia mediterranea (strain MF3/22) TaxID=694068 RepID=UPI00044092B4|nr:FAD/NAD-binding domain-containing protein [Fomitiporia mediterranea MF3/22]EJD00156.1 FAD/NAD-binding domain-containing protein [Fomitiporia mediterranea MF3/22]